MSALAVALAVLAALRGAWSPCGLSVLTSLNPLSEGLRGHRFGVTAAWYLAGAAAGGALLGGGCAAAAAVVGLVPLPASLSWGAVLVAALVAVASDSRLVPFALPDHPRQVDERWLVAYRRWVYAGGYGLQIGTGYATYIMTAAVHLTVVLAVLSGSPRTAFVAGLVFGAVRGLTLLVVARARTPQRLRALMARVDALDALSLSVAASGSAAVAAVAAAVLWGAAAGVAVGSAAAALLTRLTSRGARGPQTHGPSGGPSPACARAAAPPARRARDDWPRPARSS